MDIVLPWLPRLGNAALLTVGLFLVVALLSGVTGLATLIYHRHEDRILAGCTTAEETDRAYYARCLPTKLRIELVYRRTASPWMDFWIMWKTFLAVIPGYDRPRKKRGQPVTAPLVRPVESAPSK